MPLWNWFLYFIKGFIPIDGKRVGKILWLAVWIAIGLTIYHKVFESKNVTKIERIETQIVNNCPEENSAIGVKFNLWKLKLSLGL